MRALFVLALACAAFAAAVSATRRPPSRARRCGSSCSATRTRQVTARTTTGVRAAATAARATGPRSTWTRSAPTRNVTFVNRACSGGVIDDLTNRNEMDDHEVTVYVPGTVSMDDPAAREALDETGSVRRELPRRRGLRDRAAAGGAHTLGGLTAITFECTRLMEPQWNAVGDGHRFRPLLDRRQRRRILLDHRELLRRRPSRRQHVPRQGRLGARRTSSRSGRDRIVPALR